MRTAVVITTYNHPKYLGICLKSLLAQSDSDFDVLIADDGSGTETRAVCDRFKPLFGGTRLQHFWHEDDGYRKSAINNLVFRNIKGRYPYLILIDHDTIAHTHFVKDHKLLQEEALGRGERLLFMGRRIDFSPELSETVNEENVSGIQKGLSLPLIKSWWKGETENVGRAIHITSPFLQKLFRRDDVKDILGSNFSIESSLLYEINGFNEAYQSYWGEDGDLFIRARNTGAKIIGLKNYAIQYHLFHTRLEPTETHQKHYAEKFVDSSYVRCEQGVDR